MLVAVGYSEAYGGAGGDALEYARKECYRVALAAPGDNVALAGTAAVEFMLYTFVIFSSLPSDSTSIKL